MPARVVAWTRRSCSAVSGSTPLIQFSTWPPLRPLAPWPSTPASSSAMPRPGFRRRRCHAVETPVKPPPTIATSLTSRPRSGGVGSGAGLSTTHTERFWSGWAVATVNPYRPPRIMTLGTRVRLCLKDLYAQDVVEMIERETRKYEVESIEHPDHPDFERAYQVLWDAFGTSGEMEPEPVIRQMLLADPTVPLPNGTYARFFL